MSKQKINLTNTLIILILNFQFFSTLFSQNNYEVKFLIPYNNGKWGWCDTLGNIKIKPKYNKTTFFYKPENSLPEAYVEINGNKNYYIYGKGLKVPKEYSNEKRIYYTDEKGNSKDDLILIRFKNKYGIYEMSTKKMS